MVETCKRLKVGSKGAALMCEVEHRKLLIDSAGTGQILRIQYAGGSQPGSTRDIVVKKVTGSIIEAICIHSHSVKTFLVEKIQS